MPELRRDPITGRWVVFSPERKQRPVEFPIVPLPDNQNAFKSGHEHLTPPEVYACRPVGSAPNTAGWKVRVVPNRFPALRIEGDLQPEGFGFYDKINGIGAHEVIIETPDPVQQFADLSVEHLTEVLKAWRARIHDLMHDTRFRAIQIFKNHGPLAGASLSHSHSQLLALPVLPLVLREELRTAQDYFAQKERSLYQDILRAEQQEGTRLVYENSAFASFCPYASRFPFELCLLPKNQSPDYHSCHDHDLMLLADALRTVLRRLGAGLNHPCYNLVLHTAPLRTGKAAQKWTTLEEDYRWRLEILPRLTGVAGFEFGTGFFINTTLPEEAAEFLRNVKST